MDVASVFDRSPCSNARPVWRFELKTAIALLFAGFFSISPNLLAQSPLVEVALEPRLATSTSLGPVPAVQTRKEPEAVEPERIQNTKSEEEIRSRNEKKQALNFLPPQRPIGVVSIDLRSKPKNGNNVVPDNFAGTAMGQSPVVHASTSDEMRSDMVFATSRNHDELVAHHPLYFEEANLERYGRSCGPLQPALSSLRFFATIPSLPYAMAVHHPYKTYATQWPYAAGWGAPKVKELQPLKVKPSLVQAGAITGLLFVLP